MKVVCTIVIWFDSSDQTITMSDTADLMRDALDLAFCQNEEEAKQNIERIHSFSGKDVSRQQIIDIFYRCKDASVAVQSLRALDWVNVDVFFNLIGSVKAV